MSHAALLVIHDEKETLEELLLENYISSATDDFFVLKDSPPTEGLMKEGFFRDIALDDIFYDRFLKDLNPKTRLTVVDYHI